MPSPARPSSTDGRTSRLSRFLRLFAAWQAVFCSSHCWTPPVRAPELAAAAHALCCTSQLRPRAALTPTKVSPLTENGRLPEVWMTGGAVPPRDPVNAWTLVPEAEPVLLPGRDQSRLETSRFHLGQEDVLEPEASGTVPLPAAGAAEAIARHEATMTAANPFILLNSYK